MQISPHLHYTQFYVSPVQQLTLNGYQQLIIGNVTQTLTTDDGMFVPMGNELCLRHSLVHCSAMLFTDEFHMACL